MNINAAQYDFLIQTTHGVMTPPEFLEKVFELVWPDYADNFEFTLTGDTIMEIEVTYVIEPFDVVKTIDYVARLTPGELRLSCGNVFSTDHVVDVNELATSVSNDLYADFVDEAIL